MCLNVEIKCVSWKDGKLYCVSNYIYVEVSRFGGEESHLPGEERDTRRREREIHGQEQLFPDPVGSNITKLFHFDATGLGNAAPFAVKNMETEIESDESNYLRNCCTCWIISVSTGRGDTVESFREISTCAARARTIEQRFFFFLRGNKEVCISCSRYLLFLIFYASRSKFKMWVKA